MPATISPEAQKWLESLDQQKVGPPESLAERRAAPTSGARQTPPRRANFIR
jgi:hypothetical protein